MSSLWATSGRVKIERAKEHIINLASEIDAFFKTNPYGAVGEDDPDTGDWVIRATVRETPPLRLGAIAGDAVHNLGSALDILYCAVFGTDRGRKSHFPTFDSAEEHRRRFRGHVKPARKPAMDLLKATNAYPGGNDALVLLDLLNNEDKHETLVPAYGSIGTTRYVNPLSQFFPGEFPDLSGFGLNWAKPVCPVENGTELDRVLAANRSGVVDMNPQFILEIAFGESGCVYGKPMLPTLGQFGQAVEAVEKSFVDAGFLK